MLKFYDFNAELVDEKKGEAKVSFNIQGVNKIKIFVQAFQAGKETIEGIQSGDSIWNYTFVLLDLVKVITGAMKKSK